jgi:phosphoenolpyruvate carboxykinase (ATP)
MPLHPGRYAELLGEKIRRHDVPVWLINTGWTGGPCGEGQRIRLAHTRRMVNAALSSELDGVEFRPDPLFGLSVPVAIEGVPGELLSPRETWNDPAAYDARAHQLAEMFEQNFAQYADGVSPEVAAAGPKALAPLTSRASSRAG